MEDRSVSMKEYPMCYKKSISWSAIIFGAIVAVGLGFMFNIFGLAVGLTAFPVTPEGKAAYAAWGLVGLSVISIVTMFIAGWSAGVIGRSHCCKRNRGEFYGFGAWCLALILTIILASQIGQFLNQRVYTVNRTSTMFQLVNQVTQNVNQATELSREPTSPETKDSATTLGMTSFATFFLLFIGALSAAFGGRIGMRCCCKKSECCCPTVKC